LHPLLIIFTEDENIIITKAGKDKKNKKKQEEINKTKTSGDKSE